MGLFPYPPSASPVPTPAPAAAFIKQALGIRQDGLPGDTCGYLSGTSFIPATCEYGSTCVFDTPKSAQACCDTEVSSCAIATTCLPYSLMSGCLDDCQNDDTIFKCSDSSFPYCFTNTFVSPSAFGYGCESVQRKGSIIVPTFVMTDVEGKMTTFFPVNEETNTNLVAAATFTNDAFPAAATTIFSESSSPTGQGQSSQNLVASQGPSVSSSSPASPSSASSNGGSSSLSPGIIAAIAVPSLVVVVLLAVLTTLIVRKRKKARRVAYDTPYVGPYTQVSPPIVQPQNSPWNPSVSIPNLYSSPNSYPPPGISEMEAHEPTHFSPR